MTLLHRNSTRIIRPVSAVLVVALATAVMMFTALPSAEAASRNGDCGEDEFCYYHNSNITGSVSDFPRSLGSIPDYGVSQPTCYEFKGRGRGGRECIKNDAASVWNRTSETVRVYYNSGLRGTFQSIPPGYRGNLNASLKNNNASHQYMETPTAPSPAPPPCRGELVNYSIPYKEVSLHLGLARVNIEGNFWTWVPCDGVGQRPAPRSWLHQSNYGTTGRLDCRPGDTNALGVSVRVEWCSTSNENGDLRIIAEVEVETGVGAIGVEHDYTIVTQILEPGHSITTVNGDFSSETYNHSVLARRPA